MVIACIIKLAFEFMRALFSLRIYRFMIFLLVKFSWFCWYTNTSLRCGFWFICRYIDKLERNMELSTQRMRFWTDTEGLMRSLGVDLVSGNSFFLFVFWVLISNFWPISFIFYWQWLVCLFMVNFYNQRDYGQFGFWPPFCLFFLCLAFVIFQINS